MRKVASFCLRYEPWNRCFHAGGNPHSEDRDGVGGAEIQVDDDNIRIHSFWQTYTNEILV